jgi:hypothetical protein
MNSALEKLTLKQLAEVLAASRINRRTAKHVIDHFHVPGVRGDSTTLDETIALIERHPAKNQIHALSSSVKDVNHTGIIIGTDEQGRRRAIYIGSEYWMFAEVTESQPPEVIPLRWVNSPTPTEKQNVIARVRARVLGEE